MRQRPHGLRPNLLTDCCSDRSRGSGIVLISSLSLMSRRDSMAPMPAKAQQLPQLPWFFTGVTLPSSRQSSATGRSCSRRRLMAGLVLQAGQRRTVQFQYVGQMPEVPDTMLPGCQLGTTCQPDACCGGVQAGQQGGSRVLRGSTWCFGVGWDSDEHVGGKLGSCHV